MYSLLNGLRIVEAASFIAGPSCALHMHQLGAEVIRIDPIGGGPDYKRWPVTEKGDSLYWEGLNKGKKSVAVDLRSPDCRELAVRIITAPGPNAGLFVTNFPAKGFLSHDNLKQHRSDLITARVMGWSDGESAVDYTVNAAIGVPYMTGSDANGNEPVNHVLPAWDLMTGAYTAFTLLAAERHRRETGLGQEILVPLSDVAIASLGHMGNLAEVMHSGNRDRMGNALYGAFGRDFMTADQQRIMIVAITARQWSGLIKSLELTDAITQLENRLGVSFGKDEGERFTHRHLLFPLIEVAVATFASDELKKRFEANGVCWAPYLTLSDAIQNEPRFSPNGPIFDSSIIHPSGRQYPAPGAAATFTSMQRNPLIGAPKLGAHTEEVLADQLGMSSSEISALVDAGVIAGLN